jgi:hypothetical protein
MSLLFHALGVTNCLREPGNPRRASGQPLACMACAHDLNYKDE